jgi:hypothetical protein
MNKLKLLSATTVILTALSVPALAQGRGGDAGGAAAGGGAAVGGGPAAGGGAAIGGGAAVGAGGAGGGAAVRGGGSPTGGVAASGGRGQFGGSAGAPQRGGYSGSMRDSSSNIGASGAVRGDGGRSFASDRHGGGNWHHGHRGHRGGFAIGAGYPYYGSYAYAPSDCYLVRRKVMTRYGWRVHRVRVCD